MGRAKGPTYRVHFRRKREGRTDYRLRYRLLKSGKPQFIVRRSLRYVYVSISRPEIGGDRTILTVSSKILRDKFGWYGLKNIPAAYLTGYIAGRKALEKGINEAVLNLGYAWSRNASIPYAAAMGAIDAGLKIPIGEEAYIDEERIKGFHISEYAKLLKKSDLGLYKKKFSVYLKTGVDPENIPKLFEEVKDKIIEEFGGEDAE